MDLFVQSLYNSIDGEFNGFQGAGQLCTFIRLKGCNLQCRYCDTTYAQKVDPASDPKMSVEETIKWPDLLGKVTITGGEPLIQPGAEVLAYKLLGLGVKVTIETNGTHNIFCTPDDYNLRFVVDYKLPSSGMEAAMNPAVFHDLRKCDVVKFVIADFDDYYVARGLATASGWSGARKVFSPAISNQKDFIGWPAALAGMMIKDAKMLGDVQFSLQVHKILWPNAKVER